MSQILRFVLLKEIPKDLEVRQQWNALVRRVDRPQVFYTYEWALAVERAYSKSLRPWLFLAYDEQECLCAVAALALSAGEKSASFLCATTGDYCDVLCVPEQKSEFVAALMAQLRRDDIDNITLTNLPADSDTVAAIRKSSARNHYHCFTRTAYVCAQVELAKLERRPGENKPVLPRKKMLRRFLNAMGRVSPVRLEHLRSWETIEPVLPQFMNSHIARFLLTGRISNMARPERRIFLAELARLLSESGWISLTRMVAGENTFAWNYGFQFEDTWFWYQPTFDSELEKYSPGFCLLAKIVEEATDNPNLKIVDLGLGAEEYKDRFTNRTRETVYLTLKTSASDHVREIIRYRSAQIVKASPRLEASVRAAATRLRHLRDRTAQEGIASTVSRVGKRVREVLWSDDEVIFFEWTGHGLAKVGDARLQSLNASTLAAAAEQLFDDEASLTYLLRAASRLREVGSQGFGLVDSKGRFLHFAWVSEFDGFFLSELNGKVKAPAPSSVMLFDCWTPVSQRGHGYYGEAISLLAAHVRDQGKLPWIFSAAGNSSSIRGLEKAGFHRRYSLVRRRTFGVQRIQGDIPKSIEAPTPEVSARR